MVFSRQLWKRESVLGKRRLVRNIDSFQFYRFWAKFFRGQLARDCIKNNASKQSFLLSSIRIQIKNQYTACTNGHNGTDPENTHLDVSRMLLDLRKLFDTINHEILWFELESYGVTVWEVSGCISIIVPNAFPRIISIRIYKLLSEVYHKDRFSDHHCF